VSRDLTSAMNVAVDADSEEEMNHTFVDDSAYKAHSLKQLLADNMSDLDALQKKFKESLDAPTDSEQTLFDLSTTVKYDKQRETLSDQLKKAKPSQVYNPFESKINEHPDEEEDDGVIEAAARDSFDREEEL
jgi:hypothetical protein